jgi:hypothetical protein
MTKLCDYPYYTVVLNFVESMWSVELGFH